MVYELANFEINDFKSLYFHLFENNDNSVFLVNEDGKIIDCNNTAQMFLNHKKQQIVGEDFLDFIKIPLGFYSTSSNNFNLVSDKELNGPLEFSFKKKDGSLIWLSIKITQITLRKISFFLIICEDITEKKILEINSIFSQEFLEKLYDISLTNLNIYQVIDSGRDFIFKDTISTKNKEDLKKEDILGHSILDIFPYANRYELYKKFQQVYNSGSPERMLIQFEKKDKKSGLTTDFHIYKLSPNEIITFTSNPLEEFDLKKLVGDFKELYLQIRLNTKTTNKKKFYNTVLNSILSKFIGTINFNKATKSSLKDLGDAVEGSRVFLFLFDENHEFMFNTHEWCNENIESHQDQFKKVSVNQFPWAMKQIFKGEYINISDVSKLPLEANSLKKLLDINRVKAELFIPIYIGGAIGGFIGIDDEKLARNWDNEDINLLQICSQIIGNAIERKNFEEKLKLSEKKYRNLFNKSNHLIALINSKGEMLDVNDTLLKSLKCTKDEIIGNHFSDIYPNPPSNLKILKNKLEDLILRGSFEPVELNVNNKDFEINWVKLEATLFKLGTEQLIQVIIQDITKQKKLEQMLIDSGKQYRSILESITEAIHVINNNMQIIFINSSFLNWLRTLDISTDIVGKKIENLFPFLPKKIVDEYQKVFQTGEALNTVETSYIRDVKFITETQKIPIKSDGKVKQVITIVRDITNSFTAQEQLKESEEKYRALFQKSPLPIYILDLDGTILDGNPAIQVQFGYNIDVLRGLNFKESKFIPRMHLSKVLEAYKTFIKDEITEPVEIQAFTADGSKKWIKAQASLVNLNEKKVIQIIAQDIDDIKRSKVMVLESEIKYRDVLENINEGFFEVDLEGKFTSFNDSLYRSIGYTRKELMNKSFSSLFNDETKNKISSKFNELYRKGKGSILFDYEIITKDGHKVFHESSIYLIYDHEGKIIGFRGLVRDISERKKAETLREKFKENLERDVKLRTGELNEVLIQQKLYLDQILKASNFKTEFLSSMSHELRTPLNAIIGFTDLLLGDYYGQLNKDQRDFIMDIEESSNHLLDMITNILDISKIESGEISLDVDQVKLNIIISSVISTLQPLFNKKHLRVNIKGLSADKIIYADKIKLKQIIYNLLSNAIKFTEIGMITFEFKENLSNWEFKIKDTGIGIAEEDFDVVFKDFKRVNCPYVNSIPGSGLGLALTKRLIGLHGGNISFTSKIGNGTTFKFNIPKKIKKEYKNIGVEGFLKSFED